MSQKNETTSRAPEGDRVKPRAENPSPDRASPDHPRSNRAEPDQTSSDRAEPDQTSSDRAGPAEFIPSNDQESLAADPRLDTRFFRRIPGTDDVGAVTLLGVVHDHPSSVFRTRNVVNALDHSILALEMPPMALPLYREYARDTRTPPVFGGEMSAAIQASTAPVVGIDGPSAVFFGTLTRTLQEERASVRDLYRLARSVIAVSRHTLVCKLAATVATHTSMRVEVGTPVAHDCSGTDSPGDQADDERRCVSATRSLLGAIDPPTSVALRERSREACMAQNLRRLRARGDVVAIVGIDHLDPLVERVSEA